MEKSLEKSLETRKGHGTQPGEEQACRHPYPEELPHPELSVMVKMFYIGAVYNRIVTSHVGYGHLQCDSCD